MSQKPSGYVLKAMFGSDEPIGFYAEEAFERDMARAKTLQEVVRAAVLFAKAYHGEQAAYDAVSPYGGEDIEVLSEETLALSKVDRLSKHPACIGIDRLCLCKELYAQMGQMGVALRETRGFIQEYETKARIAAGYISAPFRREVEHYEKAAAYAEAVALQEVEAIHQEGAVLRFKAETGLKRLERKWLGLYKWFVPEKYLTQRTALEGQLQAAAGMEAVTPEDVKQKICPASYERAIENMASPPRLLGEPIFSAKALYTVMNRFKEEIVSPEMKEDYLKICAITGRCPISIPEPGNAPLEKLSIRATVKRLEMLPNGREHAAPQPMILTEGKHEPGF